MEAIKFWLIFHGGIAIGMCTAGLLGCIYWFMKNIIEEWRNR